MAEGTASGDTKEAVGRVGPVWAKVDEEAFFGGYLQRGKQHVKRYQSSSFVGQIRQFRPAEKSTR